MSIGEFSGEQTNVFFFNINGNVSYAGMARLRLYLLVSRASSLPPSLSHLPLRGFREAVDMGIGQDVPGVWHRKQPRRVGQFPHARRAR